MAITSPPAQPVHSAAEDAAVKSTDKELAAKLERFLILKELASEFEALKKELKPVFEKTERIEIGDFVVTGKYVSQPAKTMKAFTYWDMRVKRKLDYTLQVGQSEVTDATVAG